MLAMIRPHLHESAVMFQAGCEGLKSKFTVLNITLNFIEREIAIEFELQT